MRIEMWKTMGLDPITKISYGVVINPMSDTDVKVKYMTESKFKMYFFIFRHFTKSYIKWIKADKTFIEESKGKYNDALASAAKVISPSDEAVMKVADPVVRAKKPYYKKKFKNNATKV